MNKVPDWTPADMPDLAGRTAIVTGANSGIGWWTAAELARHGAHVTLAVRDAAKGAEAAERIDALAPGASVDVGNLDLADLSSVRSFASEWSAAHSRGAHAGGLDLLVNNAGVMAIPRRESADGYEMQFATNHLGHFALTGLLLPALVARPRSRVVTVSSTAHTFGRINGEDLMGELRYHPWSAYGQSKLANLLFTGELQRLLDANHLSTKAMAAHPGYAATNLQMAGPRMSGRAWLERPMELGARLLAQSAEQGAWPTLFAATAPGLPGDSYAGPGGFMEQRGHPKLVGRSARARDKETARRLWHVSEQLTGVVYPVDTP